MSGLRELPDRALTFDKPSGRIVEIVAGGQNISPEAIRAYYEDTLPQLGWTRTGPEDFLRENETLHVFVSQRQDGYSLLKIRLLPLLEQP